MITLILLNYLPLLVTICTVGFLLFVIGLYFIRKNFIARQHSIKTFVPISESASTNKNAPLINYSHAVADVASIAGDDVLSTQLDLARAYIETGKHALAKKILSAVNEKGSHYQQQEAQRLLNIL